MHAQLKLGRILGIEIGLHYSWFIIASLITLSLSTHFSAEHPAWSGLVIWAAAILTALLFFAALLAHELSHSLVARSRGTPVPSITLFALGGVANLGGESKDARTELTMAAVGPITSAALGALALGAAGLLGWSPGATPATPASAILVWLGYINVAIAIFNTIPGFPMDGGRVLRALLWWRTGDRVRSTRIAAGIGQVVALGFIVMGVLQFFAGAGLGGLWIAFIGWFLLTAASAEQGRIETTQLLGGVRAGDVMTQSCPRVDRSTSLHSFVDGELLKTGRRCYLVTHEGEAVGLLTLADVKNVDRDHWKSTSVGEAMRPLDALRTVEHGAAAREALEAMAQNDLNQVGVVRDGRLVGIVTRADLLSVLQTRRDIAFDSGRRAA